MAVKIAKYSRLSVADLYRTEGVTYWDIIDMPAIPVQEDDEVYVVKKGVSERIDRIATRFYGNPRLWWVIAVANDIEIHPTDLNEGDTLRIPAPRFVLQELIR